MDSIIIQFGDKFEAAKAHAVEQNIAHSSIEEEASLVFENVADAEAVDRHVHEG